MLTLLLFQAIAAPQTARMPVPKLDFQRAPLLVLFSKSYLEHICSISLTEGVGRKHKKNRWLSPYILSLNDYAPATQELAIRALQYNASKKEIWEHTYAPFRPSRSIISP